MYYQMPWGSGKRRGPGGCVAMHRGLAHTWVVGLYSCVGCDCMWQLQAALRLSVLCTVSTVRCVCVLLEAVCLAIIQQSECSPEGVSENLCICTFKCTETCTHLRCISWI